MEIRSSVASSLPSYVLNVPGPSMLKKNTFGNEIPEKEQKVHRNERRERSEIILYQYEFILRYVLCCAFHLRPFVSLASAMACNASQVIIRAYLNRSD